MEGFKTATTPLPHSEVRKVIKKYINSNMLKMNTLKVFEM